MEEEEVDYYAILNVSREATVEEIRAAYKRLALTFHPDSHAGRGDSERVEGATQQFRRIKEAYECLSDDSQRGVYDLYGVAGLRGGWALGAKYPTVEELQRAWAKQQRRLVTEQFVAETDSWDPLHHSYRLPEVRALQLRQRVHTPMGNGHVTLEGVVGSENGNGGGELSLTVRQGWKKGQWKVLGTVGSNGVRGSLSLEQQLSAAVSGSLTVGGGLGGVRGGTGATLSLQRNLSGGALLHGGWTLSRMAQVGLSLPWGGFLLSSDVRAAEGGGGAVGVSLGRQVSRDYHVAARLQAAYPMGSEVVLSTERQWGRYTSLGVGVGASGEGLSVRLSYKRGGLKFSLPIQLSDHVTVGGLLSLFLGVGLGVWLGEQWVGRPYWEARHRQKLARQREARKEELSRLRTAALSAVSLMTPAVQRRRMAEAERGGLVIVQGWYGVLLQAPQEGEESPASVIDVTVPLQYLVEDSRLRLHETSKANLLGFWDPAYGEEKHLYVRYLFKDQLHQVTIHDSEPLAIPRKADLIRTEN